ncbi:MAG: hypothetical protein IPJ88_18375 [Myxococcales bacterium]|nr:MAG: hypothetical protein IPJ88_18375 [Myxococcales bacterium]
MREICSAAKIERFIKELGEQAKGPGTVYLTGGATAVLIGWRQSTVDVDLKFDPEPAGIFQAIPSLKEHLNINVEMASPDMFIPPAKGWKSRSELIVQIKTVEFRHFDFISQALAKIERGHERDISDVSAMIKRGLVKTESLRSHFELLKPDLLRYPSIDPEVFEEKLNTYIDDHKT